MADCALLLASPTARTLALVLVDIADRVHESLAGILLHASARQRGQVRATNDVIRPPMCPAVPHWSRHLRSMLAAGAWAYMLLLDVLRAHNGPCRRRAARTIADRFSVLSASAIVYPV